MKIKVISRLGKRLLESFSILLFYLFDNRVKANKDSMDKIKDSYKGKRIFIVCTGPSLTAKDLDKIKENGDFSFSCNKIGRIFSQTSWRPDFYTIIDETYKFTLLDDMQRIPAKIKFFSKDSFLITRKAGDNTVWMNTDGNRGLLQNPKFSEDASDVVYTIGTVTYAMIQLSVHLGFREIYIIGCDNSYAKNISRDGIVSVSDKESHFQGYDKSKSEIPIAVWEMEVGYKYAREYADKHNIHIYNATRGGCLEAFERVDFDTLFGKTVDEESD